MLDVKCNFVEFGLQLVLRQDRKCKVFDSSEYKKRTSPISVNSASLKFELSFY